jgi:hypothetical protein
MTPAEKLRARMKVLLDKAGKSSETTPKQEAVAPPKPLEIIELETDEFIPQTFISQRTARHKKDDGTTTTTTTSAVGNHEVAMFGSRGPSNGSDDDTLVISSAKFNQEVRGANKYH